MQNLNYLLTLNNKGFDFTKKELKKTNNNYFLVEKFGTLISIYGTYQTIKNIKKKIELKPSHFLYLNKISVIEDVA